MFILFSYKPMLIRIGYISLHAARRLIRSVYPFKYDLSRQYSMTEITTVERYVLPLPELDTPVEYKQLQICILKKPAWRHVVQPIIWHQQGEWFSEFQAAVEDFHFPAERGIGNEYVPLGRLIVEKVLPVTDMGIHDFETGILEFQHIFAMFRIKRTPYRFAFGYILDNGQYTIPRRILFIRWITV